MVAILKRVDSKGFPAVDVNLIIIFFNFYSKLSSSHVKLSLKTFKPRKKSISVIFDFDMEISNGESTLMISFLYSFPILM